MSAPVTVAITRFEDLVGAGLRALISADPSLSIVAADVAMERLDDVIAAERPRVTIINHRALRAGADVHRLHAAHPATHLVVLAARPTPADCNQMLALGATACLAKEVQGRDVLNAIHLASRGLHVLPRPGQLSGDGPCGPDPLTPREADVLSHLQQGRSNAEIAAALSVSVETVRSHARAVFRKLGVRTRRDLAGVAR
ncbi:MAG: response regulator transcription factor [Solirubrobacterales bacterium]|nr:response regulator transcription factor [Solirubrobacterales bacterium]